MMKYELQSLVVWAALASLLVACVALPVDTNLPSGDMSLRTLQPCAPPCWYNIVPGRSTGDDVKRILPTLPFINPQSIEERHLEGNRNYFRWRYTNPPETSGSILVQNNIVIMVEAEPGFKLELREVVDRFGSPDRVLPNNFVLPDGGYYAVLIYYPNKGLAFATPRLPHLGYSAEEYSIEPTFPINTVYYLEPITLEQLIIYVHEIRPEQVESVLERTYPWQGFGTFPFRLQPTPTP